MPRRYIHSTTMVGSSVDSDADELRELVKVAAERGIMAQSFEDELAARTGFENPVRRWFQVGEAPNGLVRRIILSNAKDLIASR